MTTGASGRPSRVSGTPMPASSCVTREPRPRKLLCSSTVTIPEVSAAARLTASQSRGFIQNMSSTRQDTPCSRSASEAAAAGATMSPQAMTVTSSPGRVSSARSSERSAPPAG